MPIPVMGTPLYEYDHMNTANKEVIKIGHVFGTIAKRTKKHTFVRFKNNDIPRLQSKEDFINSHLNQWARDGKIPMYTSHNKKINGCSARPDFGYNLATHWLLLEVDEHQHGIPYRHYAGYKPKEEFQRMCDLCAAAYKPVVILRYNPDAFQIDGKTQQIETADRVALLLARLEYYLTLAVFDDFITAEYLFYSRCPPADDNPLIGCFSFSDPLSMNNWIELFGVNWDTSTLCDAIECAQFKLQAARTTAKDQISRQRIFRQKAAIIDDSSEYLLQAGDLKCSIGTKKRFFSALQDAERENAEMQFTTQPYQMADENAFDSMNAETRAMYGMPHIHGAYSNLCYIRSNGIDNFKTGFEYFFTANQIACNMLQMFTGSRCPFTVPRILQTNIHKSLDCAPYIEKQNVRLSQHKTQILFTMYQQWIDLDPGSHTPLRLVEQQECLAFNQAITMLNQILKRMYTRKFFRSGKQLRRRNEIPNHFYIMEDLHIFQESGEDLGKPVIPPWKHMTDQRMSIASLMN